VRVRARRHVDLVDWFTLAVGLFSGCGYAFVMVGAKAGQLDDLGQRWLYTNQAATWPYVLAAVLLLGAVWGGAFAIANALPASPSGAEPLSSSVAGFVAGRVFILAWGFLVLGTVSYWQYARAYGGFGGLLDVSGAIRSGDFSSPGMSNKWSFLQRFGGFTFLSSYLFWGLLLEPGQPRLRRLWTAIGILAALSFSLYVLYSWRGRVPFAIYLATFPMGWLIWRHGLTPSNIPRVACVLVASLSVILVTDKILERGSADSSPAAFFARELSFPFVSFQAEYSHGETRWFRDVAAAPAYLLPQRVWGGMLDLNTASDENTKLLMGASKGKAGVTGTIPVDIITCSFMQGGFVGVLLVGALWGVILGLLDGHLRSFQIGSATQVLYAYAIIQWAVLTSLYGDPSHLVVRNFDFIIGLGVLWFWVHRPVTHRRTGYE